MPKRPGKESNDQQVDLDSHPSNGKQTNKISKKTNKSSGEVKITPAKRLKKGLNTVKSQASTSKAITRSNQKISTRFVEDDELVEMNVSEKDEELLGNDYLSGNEGEGNSDKQSEELAAVDANAIDDEIQFQHKDCSNNNSLGTKRSTDATDSDEELELDSEEMKSMMKFAKFLEKKGFLQKSSKGQNDSTNVPVKENSDEARGKKVVIESPSESTIYQGAVQLDIPSSKGPQLTPPVNNPNLKRSSDSSDGIVDTSDEMFENISPPLKTVETVTVGLKSVQQENEYVLFKQFLDFRLKEQRQMVAKKQSNENRKSVDPQPQPQPSTSGSGSADADTQNMTPKEKAKQLLQQAEDAKARMYQIPGNVDTLSNSSESVVDNLDILLSMLVDEKYDLVDNHIDDATRCKIRRGDFVDLARLIPKDRVLIQQDNRMIQVNKDGMSYYQPAYESELTTISNYNKWEQAFRVFSTIFVQAHPHKAKELMQYSHIIYTASLTYVWDNVYAYDIDFRLHVSKNPERSWGVILNKAWNMRLSRKLKDFAAGSSGSSGASNHHANSNSANGNVPGKKKCWMYNSGQCTYGFGCKYDHKCGVCNKYGHGAHICRKVVKSKGGSTSNHNPFNGQQAKFNKPTNVVMKYQESDNNETDSAKWKKPTMQ